MRRSAGLPPPGALVCAALLAAACSRPPAPPPAAPATTRPADAIPADLDVVVRVDLARIRGALGPTLYAALRDAAARSGDPVTSSALEHADAVWIGLRPGSDAEHSDDVVVLSGNFADLDPRALGHFGPAMDLGAGWRRWDLAEKPRARLLPARLYARRSELLVAASTAEID